MPGEKLHSANKILVRGTNWIGDPVMTTPALIALRAGRTLMAKKFRGHTLIYKSKMNHGNII